MQKPEKSTEKPKENKKKHKRKVSIFTIFLWLFLITTMSTITIGSLTKKNAIEVTDNNWNIQLVMYDRSSDTPNQAITDFTWNATNENETKQLAMQINYACTTGKEYQPGEIVIEIPGIAKETWSEYYRTLSQSNYYSYERWFESNITIAADKEESAEKQYDWSYVYNKSSNTYTFTNNVVMAENEHFEGTIQIVYNLVPRFKVQTDLEYQAKIKENIQAEEVIAMESNVCNFYYISSKDSINLSKYAQVAPKVDYTPIEDILDDYYWVRYNFNTSRKGSGVIGIYDANSKYMDYRYVDPDDWCCIKETFPEGCVLYDNNLNKVEPQEDNTYYYLHSASTPYYYYYVGYPKDTYQEGDSITNTAEVWGRYEDEEEMQKLQRLVKL